MKNFSVIVVDYHTMSETIRFILDLRACIDSKYELQAVVVDNGNGTDSEILLKNNFAHTKTITLTQVEEYNNMEVSLLSYNGVTLAYYCAGINLGYARGNNLGTIIADCVFDSDFYLISNNDIFFNSVVPIDDFIKQFENDNTIAVLGPDVVDTYGNHQSPNKKKSAFYWLIYRPWHSLILSKFIPIKTDVEENGEIDRKVYRIMGSFMFIKKEPFVEVGRFDDRTFLYFEEPILSEKLYSQGYCIYYYAAYQVIHKHGYTAKKVKKETKNYRFLIDAEFESALYYCEKYLHASNVMIIFAKLNYALRIPLYYIKEKLRSIIKRE